VSPAPIIGANESEVGSGFNWTGRADRVAAADAGSACEAVALCP